MTKEELIKVIWDAGLAPTAVVGLMMVIMFVITWVITESLHRKVDKVVSALKHIVENWPKELIQKEIHYTTILENKNGKETSSDNPQLRNGEVPVHRKEERRSSGVVRKRNGKTSTP